MTIALPSQPPPPPPAPPHFRNAEAWLASLGNVPLHRILLDVPPGLATVMDVIRWVDGDDKRLVELVNGTLVEKAMGLKESIIAGLLVTALNNFIRPLRLGFVSTEAGMIQMLMGNVRIPDVAYFRREDLPDGRIPDAKAPRIAPALAIEVLSAGNTEEEMRIKRQEYFASGVRLVWLIDPAAWAARVFTAVEEGRDLGEDDSLEAPDLLPGFSLHLRELFDLE